jgi:hypothetical protein
VEVVIERVKGCVVGMAVPDVVIHDVDDIVKDVEPDRVAGILVTIGETVWDSEWVIEVDIVFVEGFVEETVAVDAKELDTVCEGDRVFVAKFVVGIEDGVWEIDGVILELYETIGDAVLDVAVVWDPLVHAVNKGEALTEDVWLCAVLIVPRPVIEMIGLSVLIPVELPNPVGVV